jgi:hypothetical protein
VVDLPVNPSDDIKAPYLRACQLLYEKGDAPAAQRFTQVAFRQATGGSDKVLCHLLMAEVLLKAGDRAAALTAINDAQLVDTVSSPTRERFAETFQDFRRLARKSRWEILNDD